MSAVQGRRKAPSSKAGKTLIQSWVPDEIRDKASRAADAGGISLARYLQLLVMQDQVDATGCPVWLEPAPAPQEELPLKTA